MSIKVAINGFGRIGRVTFRVMQASDSIEVVAINDLTGPDTLAHLLKYDSIHGILDSEITVSENHMTVDGQTIRYSSEKQIDTMDDCYLATLIFENHDSYKDNDKEHHLPGLINLFGIESPGLTCSLSLAKKVAEML